MSRHFLDLLESDPSWISRIIIMDDASVAFHTPETKAQSKQWLPKGTPGPIKARVHASRRTQMVIAFFDSRGPICEHYVPPGSSVNSNYIIDVLTKFKRSLNKKRPDLVSQSWILHWDNAPVHSARVTQDHLASKGIRVLPHAPYSPDLAPADFFFLSLIHI